MRRALLLLSPLLAAVIAAACRDNIGEDQCIEPGNPYSYVLGGDTALVFRWPANRQPVRVYAEPVGDLQANVQAGLGVWINALRCGELTATLVADSNAADVIVRNPISTPAPPPPGTVRLAADSVGACGGVTQGDFDTTNTLTGPIRTFMYPLGTDPVALAGCYRMVTVHEMGHALGILNHSPNSDDIMYNVPRRSSLSVSDRVTFQYLHHTSPSLHPAP